MNGIKIKGMGRCVPQRVVTNEDMAKIVDTTDQWITSRTGIRHRRHCVSETHGSLCAGAARAALDREACMAQARDSFLRRVYQGATGDLVAAFLREKPISAQERDQLRQLLDEMEV